MMLGETPAIGKLQQSPFTRDVIPRFEHYCHTCQDDGMPIFGQAALKLMMQRVQTEVDAKGYDSLPGEALAPLNVYKHLCTSELIVQANLYNTELAKRRGAAQSKKKTER